MQTDTADASKSQQKIKTLKKQEPNYYKKKFLHEQEQTTSNLI